MRVSLRAHGGLAAALERGRPPRVVDTATLSAADADEVTRLVAAAGGPPTTESQKRSPDEMTYEITVESEGSPIVLRQSEFALTPEFADLLGWLLEHDHGEAT